MKFKIKKINIENNNFFEDFKIDLDKKFILLVGENGMGKSLFLDSIRQSEPRNLAGWDFKITTEIDKELKKNMLVFCKDEENRNFAVDPKERRIQEDRIKKVWEQLDNSFKKIENELIYSYRCFSIKPIKKAKFFCSNFFLKNCFYHLNHDEKERTFMDWIIFPFDEENIKLRKKINSIESNKTIFDVGISLKEFDLSRQFNINTFSEKLNEIQNIFNILGFDGVKSYIERLKNKIENELKLEKKQFPITETDDNCSGGEKKILNIFSKIKQAEVLNQYQVIMIDEIENELHPSLQLKMNDFFQEVCKKSYNVFITTHSPFILESFIKSNDCQILKFSKSGEKRKIEEQKIINGMTLGKINYEILNIADKSYHNELYDKLYIELGARTHKNFDNILNTKFDIEKSFKDSRNPNPITICFFVRSAIHYPNDYPNLTEKNIQDSIEILKDILNKNN